MPNLIFSLGFQQISNQMLSLLKKQRNTMNNSKQTYIVSNVIAKTMRFFGHVSIIFNCYSAIHKTENIVKHDIKPPNLIA